MYRGGSALLGVAPGSLPDTLAPAWTFATEGAVKSSASIAHGRVFVGSDDGSVYALELADGRKVWSFKTEDGVESCPLVLDGRVYVGGADSYLYALDERSGALVWKYKTGDKVLGGPNAFRASARAGAGGEAAAATTRIVVGSYDSKVHCVEAADGRPVWTYNTENFVNGTPAVADGRVVFGGCDSFLHVLSAADGTRLARIEAGSYIGASVALAGPTAFVGHYGNQFLCADVAAGKIRWKYEDRPFPFFASAAVGESLVLVGSRDKRVLALRRDTGALAWSFATRGKVDSSPVLCGDKVVVGSDDGRLYLLRSSDGAEVGSYDLGGAILGSPAIAAGFVVVGSEDGKVLAFAAKQR
ncbi:MAG: PQQ-binding-like beta-propeller repeat protein [Planctomycetes bacterium]|nr:PQQ-binding-like beta-propeller repeat protein [Planctomycetota bacterium]